MTKQEVAKILMTMQVSFPNFRVENKEQTILVWSEMLGDVSAEDANRALAKFIMSDTKGFAPSIGQLRALVFDKQTALSEGEAWDLVYDALCNGNYHAQEEFNKLPDDVKRAVGGPSTLREWASMDLDGITVAESNFKRAYRGVTEARQKSDRLPVSMRPQIEAAPVAEIEEKSTPVQTVQADPDYIKTLLDEWMAKNDDLR